jgi:hypothetical protein
MGAWLYIAAFLASGTGQPALKVPAPRPALAAPLPLALNFTLGVSPSTVSFSATDPDTPLVAGNSPTTVFWAVKGTNFGDAWNLSLSSAATTFTNCSTVPISAVTVTCTTATAGGGGATAACSAASTLSTTPTVVASGTEGGSNIVRNYSVTLTYRLADQWKYSAQMSPQCTLNITYNALVN